MQNIEQVIEQIHKLQPFRMRGKVLESTSLVIKASVPNSKVGDVCYVTTQNEEVPLVKTEVVGFGEGFVYLMPLGELEGIGPESEVIPTGKPFSIKCGYDLLGRVLNGLGEPMDDGVPLSQIDGLIDWSVHRESPNPYTRQPVRSEEH